MCRRSRLIYNCAVALRLSHRLLTRSTHLITNPTKNDCWVANATVCGAECPGVAVAVCQCHTCLRRSWSEWDAQHTTCLRNVHMFAAPSGRHRCSTMPVYTNVEYRQRDESASKAESTFSWLCLTGNLFTALSLSYACSSM